MNDDGYLLLAIADDFLAAFPDDEPFDPEAAYNWLVAQAHKLGAGSTIPRAEEASK